MSDNLTQEQRTYCMSRVKGKWTSLERKIHNYLKGNKIKHKMHPKLDGCPDILLVQRRAVIFLHGCFWHKCPKCYRAPKTKKKYWLPKVDRNAKRDKRNVRCLNKLGYTVLILWEHDITKNTQCCIEKIKKLIRH